MDSIETTDAELQAAMASIKQDKTPGGLRSDFEAAVATLLPADPVAKKQIKAGDKRSHAQISGVKFDDENAEVASLKIKSGKGPKTGVDLRYHAFHEYKKLTREQRTELREWRRTPEGQAATKAAKASSEKSAKKKKQGDMERATEKAIVAAVEKKVKEKLQEAKQQETDESEAEAHIMNVITKMANKSLPQPPAATNRTAAGTSFLRSILCKAQN